jgi:sulfite dehydrogenase (cytochrome) subunit B
VKKTWVAFLVLGAAAAGAGGSSVLAAQTPGSTTKTIELPPDNPVAILKPGPGAEVVRSNCIGCHSTDYIVRQPGGDAKHWEPEVKKMIAVYGASITDADVQTIVDYLAAAYAAPSAANQPATDTSAQPAASRQHGKTRPRTSNR